MGGVTAAITDVLGGGFSAGASKESSSYSKSGTEDFSRFLSELMSSSSNSMLTQLMNSIQSGTQTTTNFDPATLQALQDAIFNVQSDVTQARSDKATAVQRGTDMGQNAMEAAIAKVIEAGIGSVAEAGNNAGAYNSTVQGKLGSRLGADAAKAGAETMLASQQFQQQLASQDLLGLVGALESLMGSAKGGVTTTTTQQTSQQKGSQTGTESTDSSRTVDEETQRDYSESGESSSTAMKVGFGG